jgi:outer membrane protein assembly factor BamB
MAFKPKWIAIGRAGIVQGPIVTSDAIYAGLKENVTVRLDRHTLKKVWEVDSRSWNAGREKTGTLYRGRLAIGCELGYLAIFNLADGALVTVYQAKAPLWRTEEADGRLLVGTGDGDLLVFDESIWGVS